MTGQVVVELVIDRELLMTSFFKGLWLVASRMAYLRNVEALLLLSGGSPDYETESSEASFLEAQSSYNTGSEYEATATRPARRQGPFPCVNGAHGAQRRSTTL
jgi:hypothetical protein